MRNAALVALAPNVVWAREAGVWVNDVHSQLNRTRVRSVLIPRAENELIEIVKLAARTSTPISVAGSRHSMGGQQFATDSLCIDTRKLAGVLSFDRERGFIEVEAGIQWPQLIRKYLEAQNDGGPAWGIAQKQTGADALTLGGSLSSNIHGRGLTMQPLISNVESFAFINASGATVECSRGENQDLFRAVIGGYGLFGPISRVKLRLVRRRKLRRVVEIVSAADLPRKFQDRIEHGFLYGDFQFSINEKSSDFLRRGVFSCYQPIDDDADVIASRKLHDDDWLNLLALAYTNREKAFEKYAEYYLTTNGQTYWSDTNQLGVYLSDYAQRLHRKLGGPKSSLIISELYVPRSALPNFLANAAQLLRENGPPVIYGTVRLIEKDDESFLPWARESFACIVFNLLTLHTKDGIEKSAHAFRALIDLAIADHGSYYLTYHKFATREQVVACYPMFQDFLNLKKKHDPEERFQSDWYRHYRRLFATG